MSGVLAAVLSGCGGSSGKAAGTEGGACYGNGSCNVGLTCASNLCVRLSGAGGAGGSVGGGGQAGTGAPAGSSGQAGSSAAGVSGQAGAGGQAGTGGAGQAGATGLAGQGGAGGQGPVSYTIHLGPIQVGAGVEKTQCVVVRLGNSAAIHVGQIRNQLGAAPVQMILYTSTDTAEQTTPFDCTPFSNVFTQTGMTPLMISENPDDTLTFPSGVGVALGANQMMRIELHYANLASTDPVTVEATSTLTTMPDAAFQSAASFLAVEGIDISIPPGGSYALSAFVPFPSALAGAKIFAVTGEEHQWGASAQLFAASSAADPGTSIYLDTTWNAPALTPLQPPLTATAGAGLELSCHWLNNSQGTVTYGEGATNEVCLFVGYYYPSQGPTVCLHTANGGGGGVDVCCPGAAACATLGQ